MLYLKHSAAALIAAGAVAAVPVAPAVPADAGLAPRLTSGESLVNIPLNLFQDIVNIPANEIHALDVAARSLFFTGPWFVGSPTNVWGEDPGDPGHFESLVDLLVPFPELSGADGDQSDFNYPGLGQQLAGLAAVEIPANPTCESLDCLPLVPTAPITGLSGIDHTIWSALVFTFTQKLPVLQGWFQVPFSTLTTGDGHYFDPRAPGSIDSGVAHSGFGWQGTHPGIVDGRDVDLMPWAGEHFRLDPAAPLINFLTSLQQPFDPSGFELPDLTDFGRAVQAVVAGSFLDFNPFVEGSPLCPGSCLLPDGSQTYYGFVHVIDELWPGNPIIGEWLADRRAGTANISTPEIIDYLTWAWRNATVATDFDNGLPAPYRNSVPPDALINTSAVLPTLAQVNDWVTTDLGPGWQTFFDNVGILGPFDPDNLWDLLVPS